MTFCEDIVRPRCVFRIRLRKGPPDRSARAMNPDKIRHCLEAFRGLRVLVVGDVMLDRFIWGNVTRMSPEAPVPVVHVTREDAYPGGAANVARNLAPFAGRVSVLGVTGPGPLTEQLHALLVSGGITLITALLGTQNAILATVRLAPAEAMRPPAPGRYRRTLLERLGLRNLPPALTMILRNMERRPWRTLLAIAGIAASVAIVVMGNFFRDAIDYIVDSQFNLAMRSEVIASSTWASMSRSLRIASRNSCCSRLHSSWCPGSSSMRMISSGVTKLPCVLSIA